MSFLFMFGFIDNRLESRKLHVIIYEQFSRRFSNRLKVTIGKIKVY